MISFIMHFVPLLTMYHLRWFTTPEFEHLPASERRFGTIEMPSDFEAFLQEMVAIPIAWWCAYLTTYCTIVFVVFKNWTSRNPNELNTNVFLQMEFADIIKPYRRYLSE